MYVYVTFVCFLSFLRIILGFPLSGEIRFRTNPDNQESTAHTGKVSYSSVQWNSFTLTLFTTVNKGNVSDLTNKLADGVDGKNNIKTDLMLDKWDGRLWTAYIWYRLMSSSGIFWTRQKKEEHIMTQWPTNSTSRRSGNIFIWTRKLISYVEQQLRWDLRLLWLWR